MQKRGIIYMIKGIILVIVITISYVPGAKAQIETGVNIMESAAQFGQIQYFRTLLKETGLDDKLAGDDTYTVFAPTDQAFNDIPDEEMQQLLENPDALRELLRSHITPGDIKAESLGNMDAVTMVDDTEFEVRQHEQGISINDALMVAADIVATNGVIHAVDKVFLP